MSDFALKKEYYRKKYKESKDPVAKSWLEVFDSEFIEENKDQSLIKEF